MCVELSLIWGDLGLVGQREARVRGTWLLSWLLPKAPTCEEPGLDQQPQGWDVPWYLRRHLARLQLSKNTWVGVSGMFQTLNTCFGVRDHICILGIWFVFWGRI